MIDIRGYRGQIIVGPYQFYQEPKRMRLKQQGAGPVELVLLGSSWYGATPDPQLSPGAKLLAVGNQFFGTWPEGVPDTGRSFFSEIPADLTLVQISRALDDLRRLGELDMRLNHP